MDGLLPLAHQVAELLRGRGESIAVSESSVGGLVSAALIAQPGASAFFLGATVIYTREAGRILRRGSDINLKGLEPMTPPFVQALADGFRVQMGADWATGEMGATGPAGSPYGYEAGTGCIAVSGPVCQAKLCETGSADRVANMRAFARAQLELLIVCLEEAGN